MDTQDSIDTGEVRVAYRDIDMQGQMHNAAYLTIAEQALVRFWQHRPPLEDEPVFTVRHIECSYHRPLRYDDVARLRVTVDKIGMQSVGFAVLIKVEDVLAARVEIVWTAFDREKAVDVQLPEVLRDWLYDYLI